MQNSAFSDSEMQKMQTECFQKNTDDLHCCFWLKRYENYIFLQNLPKTTYSWSKLFSACRICIDTTKKTSGIANSVLSELKMSPKKQALYLS